VRAVIGPNGAGKTLFNAITGYVEPTAGQVLFRGEEIQGLAPHVVSGRGIRRTFQNGGLFAELTVLENVLCGLHSRIDSGFFGLQLPQSRDLFPDMTVEDNLRLDAAGSGQNGGDADADLENVFASFPRLRERRNQHARTLSGGEQQMVAIGRAVMSRPKILMLDQPSGGLSPHFVAEIGAICEGLKKNGTTMLLVEQNIAFARRVADQFLVLRDGRVADTITEDAFANPSDDALKRIYL